MEYFDSNTINKAKRVVEEVPGISLQGAQNAILALQYAGFLIREFKPDVPEALPVAKEPYGTVKSLALKLDQFQDAQGTLRQFAAEITEEMYFVLRGFEPMFKVIRQAMEEQSGTPDTLPRPDAGPGGSSDELSEVRSDVRLRSEPGGDSGDG